MTAPRLLLASSSPRRREILGRLGLVFDCVPADIDETPRADEDPVAYVQRLAGEKATAAAAPATVVIGADTTVVLEGDILGKPADRADAAAVLRRLSGRAHLVVSGVAVAIAGPDGEVSLTVAHETTEVHVRPLTAARIEWYVATGEPDDKAGSYGLQGAGGLFADHVSGSVSNVIGLPLGCLDDVCTRAGIDLLSFRSTS